MGAPESSLVVVNPAAGGGRAGREAGAALERLRSSGLDFVVRETTGPGHASRMAREAYAEGTRHFVAVGGDGTSFEVVNGLLPDGAPPATGDGRPCLAPLPLGSGNSFLRDFHDRGAAGALEAILEGRRRPCDAVRLEHDGGALCFINNLIVGFAADVGALRNRRFGGLGEAGYVLAVLVQVARLAPRPRPMALDGGPVDREPVTFVTLANSRFTGGTMMMAPGADPADGLLDVVRAGPMSRSSLLATFPKIFKGTHLGHPAVSTVRARVVDFAVDEPVDLLVDGELLPLRPTRAEVLPSALEVQV